MCMCVFMRVRVGGVCFCVGGLCVFVCSCIHMFHNGRELFGAIDSGWLSGSHLAKRDSCACVFLIRLRLQIKVRAFSIVNIISACVCVRVVQVTVLYLVRFLLGWGSRTGGRH